MRGAGVLPLSATSFLQPRHEPLCLPSSPAPARTPPWIAWDPQDPELICSSSGWDDESVGSRRAQTLAADRQGAAETASKVSVEFCRVSLRVVGQVSSLVRF